MSLNVHTFDSLALRDYRLLWLGQLANAMGIWMDMVARMWLIYTMTHSPLQLGLISATQGLPMLLFGIIAGATADRYGRKIQLIMSQAGNAVLNTIMAILILTGSVQPWHLYVTGFLAGSMQAFQMPARQVLVNELVGTKYLLNAISLNSAAFNFSRSFGPAIGGLLIKLWGVGFCYVGQAALYIMSTIWTIRMRVPSQYHSPDQARDARNNRSFLGGIRDGIRYVMLQKVVLALMMLALMPAILGMPFVSLMPIFAVDVFHGDATTQGSLLMMAGLGALAGSLGMASLGRKRQGSGKFLIGGAVGFGLSLILFASSPNLWLAMPFIFVVGFFNSSYMTQNQTIIQTVVPHEIRGRVLGIYMLNQGLMPAGSFLAGVLATLFGGPKAVAIMGFSCFLLVVAVGSVEKNFEPEAF